MATSIDIASNALVLIGDKPIQSLDEAADLDGEGAGQAAASALYEETFKSVLASHPWSFALKEMELSRLSQTPDERTGYKYVYQMPSDLIRVWRIMSYSNYDIIGNLIYSNETTLLCRYIYDVDEVRLPPHFVKALEYKLASEFAMLVTEDINKAQVFEKKYLDQVGQARSIDSQSRPQTPIVSSPFVNVRHGGVDFSGSGGWY